MPLSGCSGLHGVNPNLKNAFDFSFPALRLINDYLSNIKQRTEIESTCSAWLDIIFGVPRGTILGPPLFNVFFSRFVFLLFL